MKGKRILFGLIGAFLILALTAVIGRGAGMPAAAVDETLLLAVENAARQDPADAASRIFAAESSREKVIRDSIAASLSLEQSILESKEEEKRLLHESILAEAVAKALRESSIEASRVEESVRQSLEESLAESRRAAEEASRAAASRAAAEASKAAASKAAAEAAKPPKGSVILFGDSRTQGFLNFWPARQVIYTYDPISAHPELITKAASAYPSKIVFLNGIDDVLVYSANGAIGYYEAAITRFAKLSPKSRIYVHSVLPVKADVAKKYANLKQISYYNQLLQKMCSRHGWTYIDCRAGFSDAAYWPGGDGIHFNNTWTSKWLGQIRKAAGF